MEDTKMDIEGIEPCQNPQSFSKRFGIKNSIQTNFGEDYVFQIVPKNDWSLMGVSLSTNAVKLYSPVTGQFVGECKGHLSTINQISFSSSQSSPHVLHSCSSDGTIRSWDTRSFHQVSCVNAGPTQDMFCFSFGGSGDNLLAAGSKSQIYFWDWRIKKQIACLDESHMDEVTQVHFVPDHQNKLVSASVDGLLCTFDTSGDINDEDHLDSVSVINVGTSIGKVGFFGEGSKKLWCLTHIETLSIWDWNDGRLEVNLENARTLASESWGLDNIDYLVDCHSSGGENLWVIGGTGGGSLGYFPVNLLGKGGIGPAEAILQGGHTDIVRSVLPMPRLQGVLSQGRDIFGWTGGEDGRLCCWSSEESPKVPRSWISSDLVMKQLKSCRKSRHSPY